MKQNKSIKYSYAAGILDGEGRIRINRLSPRGYMVSPNYSLIVAISQKDGRIIDWLYGNFGGVVYLKNKKSFITGTTNWIYVWQTDNLKALEFLKKVYPFLKLKKDQAAIAIRFQGRKRNNNDSNNKRLKLSEKEIEVREKLYLLLSLKKKDFKKSKQKNIRECSFNSLCNSAGAETKQE